MSLAAAFSSLSRQAFNRRRLLFSSSVTLFCVLGLYYYSHLGQSRSHITKLPPLPQGEAAGVLRAGELLSPALKLPVSSSASVSSSSSLESPVHWANWAENYPLTSFIPLPTGTPAAIPKIQYVQGAGNTPTGSVRLKRADAVKASFQRCWRAYKEHAWLKDELRPLSGKGLDVFGNRAASLVDALDTLWILGMEEDFAEAVSALDHLDFASQDSILLNLFETNIRYLGGLLSAYDISGGKFPSLLEKATALGEMLYKAFDTPNRMPVSHWDWQKYLNSEPQHAASAGLVSELGSFSLEFTRLSQLTENPKYFDAVQRITNEFEKSQNRTRLSGMWPVLIDIENLSFTQGSTFTFGGMSDSLYEYILKEHLLLGAQTAQYQKLYQGFIEVGKKHLFFQPMNKGNLDLLISGSATVKDNAKIELNPEGQHLSCFAGGMLAIGSKVFNRPQDLAVAEKLVNGCLWAYDSTTTGLMPEIFNAIPCPKNSTCKWNETKWHEAIYEQNKHSVAAETLSMKKLAEKFIKEKRLPPGFSSIRDTRYILRPELIESVFILYRITGDVKWQERAWRMFTAIEKHTKTSLANAAIKDVTINPAPKDDRMESFWLAETLKYFYLIFSDFDVVSLDEYVLNTEAHPFKRPV
ncbi:MAG: hypothetical protein M1829_001772 [Trizodia sp. TS-e1964]|nr:MAG: hypothetical protein M1829_001772 [Trizodia sp. TS-e1964]